MEESEKRRERLKAMRIEAAQPGADIDSQSSEVALHGLSNPLIESESASSTQYTAPRFDYYTDPMAAFSGKSRRNNTTPQISHGHYNTQRPIYPGMTPSPPYQNPPYQNPHYQDQGMTPSPTYQNPPYQNPHYQDPVINSPGPRTFQVPRPHYNQIPLGNPMEAARPLTRPLGNQPRPWGGRGGNFANPVFVQGDSSYNNYGRGRGGQRYNSSSYYDSGRGRGRSFGNNRSPGRGPSGSRGFGPREHVSAEERPDLYYRREMLEDPWKRMTPIVWKGVKKVPDSEKNWLPKSISTKKAKISSEASSCISISQPSLAEYLAASFNNDIDDKQDNEDDDDGKHDNEDIDDKHDNEDEDEDDDKQDNEDINDKLDA